MAASDDVRLKRKRKAEGEDPKKRRRSVSSDEGEDPKAEILMMEEGILESKKNYNDISVLLQSMEGFKDGDEASLLAAVALCRVFVRLLAQGALIAKKSLSEKDTVVVGWLKEQLSLYKAVLLRFLETDELSNTGLTLCMRILKAEGEHMYDKEDYTFPTTFHQNIISSLLDADEDDVRQAYMEEYAEKFDDIRYFTFKSIR
jgi:U3 small nucleolar RNA-associated protein 19